MPRRRTLDSATVIRVAVALADDVGIEQLTLAQLAERLGVKIPSLYNHVAGLAGLRRELALFGAGELLKRMERAAIGKAADDAIAAIAQAYRGFAREHPGLYAATTRAPDPNDAELQAASQAILDLVLTVLDPYHLPDDLALHMIRGLRSIVHGFVSLEATGGFGLPLDLDESYQRLVQVFIDGLRGKESYEV